MRKLKNWFTSTSSPNSPFQPNNNALMSQTLMSQTSTNGVAGSTFGGGFTMLREDDRVPLEMVLSDHKMCFEDGKWRMASSEAAVYEQTLRTYEAKISELQREVHTLKKRGDPEPATLAFKPGSSEPSVQTQLQIKQLELANTELAQRMHALEFKNKVLLAMLAISDADHKALCQEAQLK